MELHELNEIGWEHIFDDVPLPNDDVFDICKDLPSSFEEEEAAIGTVDSWIEELLMKDDDDDDDQQAAAATASGNDFMWSDLLLDSPMMEIQREVLLDVSPSPSLSSSKSSASCSNFEVNVNNAANYDDINNNTKTKTNNSQDIPNFDSNGENDKSGDDVLELNHTDDDPLSKKRKRQLRNRDAAMKSRERKKMYVKDLEIKSRFMEAECRRLGRLLQCCYAENQMLRISLGSAYGAPMAKPESAVLLLESLLLVSLVWLMVNMCLLPLPKLPLSQDAVPHGSVERKELESAAPTGKRMRVTELWPTFSFMKSKRCRGSRIKMKSDCDGALLSF